MRTGHAGGWVFAVALLLAFAGGCRTPAPMPVLDPEKAPAPPLSSEAQARAAALSYFAQGLLDEQNRRFESALSNYVAAAALDPEEDDLRLRIALGLLHQRRAAEAVDVMEALCRRQPRSERVLRWTAMINRAADRMDRVEAIYRELIKLNPASPEAYLELAALLVRQEREKEAQVLLEKAQDIVQPPTEVLRLLAGLYAQQAAKAASPAEEKPPRDAAIQALERARAASPEDLSVLFQLGDLYLAAEDMENAIGCFEDIEKRTPDNLLIKQKLALSLLAVGNKDRAIAKLEELSQRQPDNAKLYYYLGELYEEKGDLEKALFQYVLAQKAAPEDPTPFLKRALLQLEDLQQPEKAAQTLLEGMEKLPDDPRLEEMLAYVYYGQKRYREALPYFRRLHEGVELGQPGPVTPTFYLHYALAAQGAGELDEAVSRLQHAITENPALLETYFLYSVQQRQDGQIRQSAELLGKLEAQQADNPLLPYYQGLLHSATQDYPAAAAAFGRAEKLAAAEPDLHTPWNAQFYFWYGAAVERSGDLKRAEELLGRCLELDPEHAEALNYLAYMWAEQEVRLDEALSYVQKALADKPDNAAFVDTLGWIYFKQGRYDQALEQLSRAAELLPDDATITDHLGDVLRKTGKPEEALARWKRAFVLDPETKSLAEKLTERGVDLAPLRQEAEEWKARKEAERAADENTDDPGPSADPAAPPPDARPEP